MSKRAITVAFVTSLVAAAIACGSDPYGVDGAGGDAGPEAGLSMVDGSASAADAGSEAASFDGPDCVAQRTVHLIGGDGGLAWFTLVWPAPAVIETYQPTYAYDDITKVASVGTPIHPLYARKVESSGKPVLEGRGKNPMPTAFVAGSLQVHSPTPSMMRLPSGPDVISAGARAQSALAPALPVLSFGAASYTPVVGAPAVTVAATIDQAIAALKTNTMLSAADEADLRPNEATLASWYPADASADIVDLGEKLLFTANLLRRGLVGTVLIPALGNDPHQAFADLTTLKSRTDALTNMLDGFYAELAKSNETTCGYKKQRLSLADNVVLVVSGDTPKNSFVRMSWPDGTNENVNYIYVRSNGWLERGWFGAITATSHTSFDPISGNPSDSATPAVDQSAALDALLFAILRGNGAAVNAIDPSPFNGVVAKSLP